MVFTGRVAAARGNSITEFAKGLRPYGFDIKKSVTSDTQLFVGSLTKPHHEKNEWMKRFGEDAVEANHVTTYDRFDSMLRRCGVPAHLCGGPAPVLSPPPVGNFGFGAPRGSWPPPPPQEALTPPQLPTRASLPAPMAVAPASAPRITRRMALAYVCAHPLCICGAQRVVFPLDDKPNESSFIKCMKWNKHDRNLERLCNENVPARDIVAHNQAL